MPDKVIELENINRFFHMGETEVHALDSVSFDIEQGELVSIMGPSGSGKSTLMYILGCLDRPTSGSYFLNGSDVSALDDDHLSAIRNHSIGFVFQSYNLIPQLNIIENVELPLLYLGFSSSERKKRVTEALEQMEIMARKSHFPQQLSGGQQQRVAVARAVVAQPKLILADEPTGNLDSAHGEEVMNLLGSLHEQGTTIIMVTHSPAYAEYSHRIIHLFDGHIVSENIQKEFRI